MESVISPAASVINSSGSASVEPVCAKENRVTDPFEVIGDEENIGTVVGVHPISKGYIQMINNKEEEIDTEARKEVPAPPPSSTPFDVAGPLAAAKEVAQVEVLDEGEAVVETTVPATKVDSLLSAESVVVAASEPTGKETALSSREPTKDVDKTTASVPISGILPEVPTEFTANKHARDLSFTSTRVTPSSRPTTPSGTAVPTESVTSTPTSVRRSKIFRLGKGSPSRASVMDGRADEFGAQDGRKKRKSSVFKSFKKLFHHGKEE